MFVFCSACGRACVSMRAQAPMRISVCMYEYAYAYMNVRKMRAYERTGAHALICLSVYMYICLYMYFYICMHMRTCVCVYVYTYVQYYFLTSNLLHLESSIYVGQLAYMRTHARQHLKLEVKHKNSHGRIHTHTY